jgi:ketosteroid isomerase-like protein
MSNARSDAPRSRRYNPCEEIVQMNEAEKQAARWEIANLNQRYARAADAADGSAYSRCFTEDGIFDRFGTEIRGRQALAELQKPNPEIKRRHFVSNTLVEFSDNGEVRGEGYQMVITFDVKTGEQKPPICIDYRDIYTKTRDGWLIAWRSVSRAF